MKTAGRAGCHYAAAVLLAISLTGAVYASEAVKPVSEDPIVAAKKDFEAIKAVTSGTEQLKASVPAVGLPQLEIQSDPAPVLSPLARQRQDEVLQQKASAGGKNWLLDAMDDHRAEHTTASTKNSRSTENRGPQEYSSRSSDTQRPVHANQPSDGSAGLEHPGLRNLDVTANPLTQYMSSWMTAQDHALLVPRLRPDAVYSDRGNSFGLTGADNRRTLSTDTGGEQVFVSASHEATNPYLGNLALPSITAPDARSTPPTKLPVLSFSSAVPTSGIQTSPDPAFAPAAPIRDALKPDPDAKYFKQLKRF